MRFALTNQKAKLRSFSSSPELHGDNPQPAGYLAFSVNLPADQLDQFSPTFKDHVFTKNGNGGADLANQTHPAPNLRYPIKAYKWDDEMVGGTIVIPHGLGGKSDLKLPIIKLSRFELAPMEGGTCVIDFMVSCHPSEKEFAKLPFLQAKEVELTIIPPEADKDLADAAP